MLLPKKLAATDDFIAKFIFCGMSLVALATFSASSLATTIPITFPLWSNRAHRCFPAEPGKRFERNGCHRLRQREQRHCGAPSQSAALGKFGASTLWFLKGASLIWSAKIMIT